jgi:hypothetical protein
MSLQQEDVEPKQETTDTGTGTGTGTERREEADQDKNVQVRSGKRNRSGTGTPTGTATDSPQRNSKGSGLRDLNSYNPNHRESPQQPKVGKVDYRVHHRHQVEVGVWEDCFGLLPCNELPARKERELEARLDTEVPIAAFRKGTTA